MQTIDAKQQRELVIIIGYSIVQDICPQERMAYSAYSDLYLKKPGDMLKQPRKTDERAGFGVVETTVILTPHIMLMLQAVMPVIVDVAKKALEGASADAFKKLIEDIFQGKKTKTLDFTEEQLAQLRTMMIADGKKNGLKEERATRIADAVVGKLLSDAR